MSKQAVTHADCPECESENLVLDTEMGERVCGNCGLVVEENIMHLGAEWRAFNPQERSSRARVGAPTKYSDSSKGLTTTIQIDRDAFGRPLPPKVKRQMWRLRRWQLRSAYHSSQHRNLSQAMDELERLSQKLCIPSSVQEMAAIIYRKALAKDLVRGRCIASIVAGALYAACRFTKIPRTLKEITKASPRNQKEVSKAYRIIVRSLEMEMPIDDPMDYVTKIAEKAGVSSEIEGLAIRILQEAKSKHATMGKDPSGLAAAALYLSSKLRKERVKQEFLAKKAGVTAISVRNRTKDLMKRLDLDIKA